MPWPPVGRFRFAVPLAHCASQNYEADPRRWLFGRLLHFYEVVAQGLLDRIPRSPWTAQLLFYISADKTPDHLGRGLVFACAQLFKDRLFSRIDKDGQSRRSLFICHDRII